MTREKAEDIVDDFVQAVIDEERKEYRKPYSEYRREQQEKLIEMLMKVEV